MFETFLLMILLVITFITALILSIRQILRSYFKSLLAWYTFIYIFVMNLAAIILPYVGLPDIFIIQYDQNIVNRIYLGLIFINFIAFIFLLLIDPIFSKRRSLADFTDTLSVNVPAVFKNRFKILYIIILIALIYLLTSPENMALIENIKGILHTKDYAYYYAIRSIGFQSYINPLSLSFYVKLVIFKITIPLICLYSLYGWLLTKKYIWLQRWVFALIIWIIESLFTIQKGPILVLVLTNVILSIFVQYEKKKIRNFKSLFMKIVIYSSPLSIAIICLYTVLGFEGNLLYEVLNRIVFEPIYTTYAHFATFPDVYPQLSLSSSKFLSAIASKGQTLSNPEPYQLAAMTATGVFYNANTSMLGNGWAKSGYLGIILYAILFFGVLLCWDIYLKKIKRHLPLIPIISLYLGKSIYVLNIGANNMLITHGFLVIPIIYILLFYKQSCPKMVLRKHVSVMEYGT